MQRPRSRTRRLPQGHGAGCPPGSAGSSQQVSVEGTARSPGRGGPCGAAQPGDRVSTCGQQTRPGRGQDPRAPARARPQCIHAETARKSYEAPGPSSPERRVTTRGAAEDLQERARGRTRCVRTQEAGLDRGPGVLGRQSPGQRDCPRRPTTPSCPAWGASGWRGRRDPWTRCSRCAASGALTDEGGLLPLFLPRRPGGRSSGPALGPELRIASRVPRPAAHAPTWPPRLCESAPLDTSPDTHARAHGHPHTRAHRTHLFCTSAPPDGPGQDGVASLRAPHVRAAPTSTCTETRREDSLRCLPGFAVNLKDQGKSF